MWTIEVVESGAPTTLADAFAAALAKKTDDAIMAILQEEEAPES